MTKQNSVVVQCVIQGKRALVVLVLGEYATCPECDRSVILFNLLDDSWQVLTDPSHPILMVVITPGTSPTVPDASAVQDRLL